MSAVMVLSVALVCALVAIVVLLLSRGRGAPAEPVRAARLGSTAAVAQPPSDADPPGAWAAFLAPTDLSGVERLLVNPWPTELAVPQGRLLPAGAPLARAIQEVLRHGSASGAAGSMATASVEAFFRFEASPALLDGLSRGLYEIMPAVEGGFRSNIRAVAGKNTVGHGRYVPLSGSGSGVPTALLKAPKLAPRLGVALLTAGLELAAEADQRRRLEALHKLTSAVREEQIRRQIDELKAAAEEIDLASSSVLDAGFVPVGLGVDSAAHTARTAWQRSLGKLEEWQVHLDGVPGRVDLDPLERAFPGITDLGAGEFWRELALFRGSLAVHTRATLLAAAEAAAHDPAQPYTAFRGGIERRLAELDEASDRLRTFVRGLADRQITVGRFVQGPTANRAVTVTRRLMRVAEELAHPLPLRELPVAIGPGGRLQLQGAAHPDGSVTLLGADSAAPEKAARS